MINSSSKNKLTSQGFSVKGEYSGYRNRQIHLQYGNKEYMLCIYKKEKGIKERIDNADRIMSLCYPTLPVKQRIKVISSSPNLIILYSYLPGSTISWEGYTMKHIKGLGEYMGKLHTILGRIRYKDIKLENEIDLSLNHLKEMDKYFKDKGVLSAMKNKLNISPTFNTKKYLKVFEELNKLDSQILHMDFVRGNILFNEKKEITGIIDFEKCSYGPRVLDIARTLAFLLIDCKYKSEDKVRKYFLHSGYSKRGEMKLPSTKLTDILVEHFLLYDFFKFLYHTPYESLKDNEHFIRTRNRLLESKVICLI